MSAADRAGPLGAGAIALMVVLTSSWGLSQVAMKIANTGFSPLLQCFLRSAIGTACIFGWCLWRRVPLKLDDGSLPPGIAIGLLFSFEFISLYIAMDITSAARGILIFNTMPFWVLIIGHFIGLERLSARKLAGMALAFCGLALVFADKVTLPDRAAIIGDFMILAASIAWALIVLVIKTTTLARTAPEKNMLYQLGISALVTLPFIPFGGAPLRDVTLLATGTLLFQALFIVSVTYLVFFSMIQRYSAASLSSFAFLTPVTGIIATGLILKEPISWQIAAALALIASGLMVVNRRPRRASTMTVRELQ